MRVTQDQIVPSPLTADQTHPEWEIPVRGDTNETVHTSSERD